MREILFRWLATQAYYGRPVDERPWVYGFQAPIFTEIVTQLKECWASDLFLKIVGIKEQPEYSSRELLDSTAQAWIDIKDSGGMTLSDLLGFQKS